VWLAILQATLGQHIGDSIDAATIRSYLPKAIYFEFAINNIYLK